MVVKLLSGAVLVAGCSFFFWLTALVFAKPAAAERFFMKFASSARTHFIEQILRILFGVALVVFSPAMWQAQVFGLVGWVIVASSVGLMLTPWQWHHRFAVRLFPIFIRYMRLYAIGVFVFSALIFYAMFSPQLKGTA